MIELSAYEPHSLPLTLKGDFQLKKGLIEISFKLEDDDALVVDAHKRGTWSASTMERRHELWKSTCFEAFWSVPGSETYWELNLSPNAAYNIYEFSAYRKPQPPVESDAFAIKDFRYNAGQIRCILESDIQFDEMNVSLCTILKLKDEKTLHYALKHAGPKPDFHLKESFTLHRKQS